jgi:hypothetical protein
MTLQTSGAISLGDIGTEFEDSAPHSLSEFYGATSGIPASGAISIGDFYGKSFAPTSIVRTSSARYGGTSTNMTVTGVSIGTAASNRYVVVAIAKRYYQQTSCTIGGVTATEAVTCPGGIGIWYALVPTGTTADINFTTTNNSGAYAALTTWAVYGGDPANWVAYDGYCDIATASFNFDTPATPSAMLAVNFEDDQTSNSFSGDLSTIAAYDLNTSDYCAFGEGIFSTAATGRLAYSTMGSGLGADAHAFFLIK